MLTFEYDTATEKLTAVHGDHQPYDHSGKREFINRNDIRSMAHAERIAQEATELTGQLHIPTDAGGHVSPRIDVIRCPALGDEVSYAFNGDSYPDGEITGISPTLKVITTSTGSRYHRRGRTGSWIKGGTWSLIQGHHDKRNPSF